MSESIRSQSRWACLGLFIECLLLDSFCLALSVRVPFSLSVQRCLKGLSPPLVVLFVGNGSIIMWRAGNDMKTRFKLGQWQKFSELGQSNRH